MLFRSPKQLRCFLIGERNEETAQLFGEPKPAMEQPMVVASAAAAPVISEAASEVVAAEK